MEVDNKKITSKEIWILLESLEVYLQVLENSSKFKSTVMDNIGGRDKLSEWVSELYQKIYNIIWDNLKFDDKINNSTEKSIENNDTSTQTDSNNQRIYRFSNFSNTSDKEETPDRIYKLFKNDPKT